MLIDNPFVAPFVAPTVAEINNVEDTNGYNLSRLCREGLPRDGSLRAYEEMKQFVAADRGLGKIYASQEDYDTLAQGMWDDARVYSNWAERENILRE